MVTGVDSLVIAGTGTGKTMPFMMPLMLDSKKKALIISPLKILQADQVCQPSTIPTSLLIFLQASRFEKAKVSAVVKFYIIIFGEILHRNLSCSYEIYGSALEFYFIGAKG